MLEIKDLSKIYADTQNVSVLKSLSLELKQGQSLAITGASGCGKSTLLHLIAGLDSFDSGEINLAGLNLSQASSPQLDSLRRQDLGIVFQRYNLIDSLSVWDNACFSLAINPHLDTGLGLKRVEKLLQLLQISELKNRYVHQLSGGQQQRVAIARALAHQPKLLLADEPTGNLDEETSEQVSNALFELCQHEQTALIVVTHSQSIADKAQHRLQLHLGHLQSLNDV
ncbi:ABC transporter ATP-binding protein [Alginatibacterium sediminis]|uniref:ABC transporter ATP-binding protein n=1 Tax=Alginatibacterium sediminis TaxID=2164068 RepID=A0A420E911_9ALTE|nr:ABC transporter ATP-binding protein [Alginatibacterium sediminis]